ncbi:DNA replication and repair protein RecF [Clostridium ragsdalei P11]|uniref:Nuclease SbcCD subunit C n=1 Tax=Clostridium ragsdalei P11 TaxID=1353534 RepID=A0A1A6ARG5_9CLOT|nr:AAA family ATPase [Clostridium ragsdalei]OBR92676.1 DNA replication and repair protein RecF [Clostridium ragsdalei P11]
MSRYRLGRIHLENYKLFDKKDIDFSMADLFVLDGPNGYGKTSIFEAIEYLVTGDIKRAEECPEVSGKLSYDTHFLSKNVDKNVVVSGELISGENVLKIERCINVQSISGVENNPKNLKNITNTMIWFCEKLEYNGMAEGADAVIKKYLGNDLLEDYYKFYYISQEDRLKFLMASETKRMEQISSLFNIDNEISEYTKYNSFKKKLSSKVNKLKEDNKAERTELDKDKGKIEKSKINREYKDIFQKCKRKPYWNEKAVKIKDKEKLDEILTELKKVAVLSRHIEEFQTSLVNSQFDRYISNKELLKKLLIFNAIYQDIDNKQREYKTFEYLKSLPTKEDSEEIDIEKLDFQKLKENINIEIDIVPVLRLQREILKARRNQNTYNKSLEKLQGSRENLTKSLSQWREDGGTEIKENVCPYCGTDFKIKAEYEKAIVGVESTLKECTDGETEKIKEYLLELQSEYDEKFKVVITKFINENSYMDNDLIKNILHNVEVVAPEYRKFSSFLHKQQINLNKSDRLLKNEDECEIVVQRFQKTIQDNYINSLSDEYILMQKENCFFKIFESVFDSKIENIEYISEKLENEKRLYLEEQYQLQEYDKLIEREKILKKKEKVTKDLDNMKSKVKEIISIYKNKIGQYQKKIIGKIQIPLYIYSGRVLQYYQGGLGIFIKYDTKGEKLDSIRFLASKQSDHDVLYTLSSGQLTGVIIALTLTLNKIYGKDSFSCMLIDDPVQTMDDLNVDSLVELLRNEFRDYQMIVSTHEEEFSRFIRYKYKKYKLIARRYQLNE